MALVVGAALAHAPAAPRWTLRSAQAALTSHAFPIVDETQPDEPDYDAEPQLYIDPDECIDCDACVEACPVDACFAEDQLPEEWQKYIQINADYYASSS